MVAAFRPVQATARNPLAPRPECGHVDPQYRREPRRPGRGHVQALSLSRGKERAIFQRNRNRNTQLTGEVVVAGAGMS